MPERSLPRVVRVNRRHIRRSMRLVLLALLLAPGLTLAAWPVTNFEVFLGDPWSSDNTWELEIGRAVEKVTGPIEYESSLGERLHFNEATVIEIERYLGEVARRYSDMGFLPPALEPIIERKDGTRAYRVYLYDFDRDTPAYYASACDQGEARRLIRIDSLHNPASATLMMTNSGQLTDKGYQDLAHELFHAVQGAYPLDRENCRLGDWIAEGTAQAVGVDMARELRGVEQNNDLVRWGVRQYYKPLWMADDLPQPEKTEAYQTASFWRYIGERVALAGGIPGVDFVAPDYSYLHDFFSSSLPGASSENTELAWIDSQLSSPAGVGMGLSRLYPYFVSTLAGYVNRRLQPITVDDTTARTIWLGELFGHCPYLSVDANNKPASYTLKLGKVTAGCWLLGSDVPAALAVQVTASGAPAHQLAALAVGTHNGQVVDKPEIVSVGAEEFAFWLFRVDNVPGEQTVFVISNVAEQPETTDAVKVDIEVTISGWQSTLGTP